MEVRLLVALLSLAVAYCRDFPECVGRMQSPIALSTQSAFPGMEFLPLELSTYEMDPTQVMVRNDGYTAIYSFQFPDNQPIIARGGVLMGEFQFDSLHFHWGANSDRGTEHVIDGGRYAMEVHLVFFNRRYESIEQAQTQRNGLAVLGLMLTNSSDAPNYGWVPALNEIQQAETSYTLPDPTVFNIRQFIGPDRRPYFNYHGSLTTPPCYESVNWLVQKKVLLISEEQLNVFRSLRDADGNQLVDNFRSLQPINGRPIVYYR
ncbi:carbonic anhydrase 2-like [Toxorhynchites rutilus septentrionalis]|uniref:carbonic anhydrase 2-like n=1 Tax=Toxorhynchites rutilus septentrionalis TaxID=329112 RepID=UPI002478B2B3|nr:carbonic anhydrase 2-like [Toxorhynchites rutilus septentrionalis]